MDQKKASDTGALIDRICDAFEAAWQVGARPALESFLEQAAVEARPVLLSELVRLDIDYRRRAGETPAPDEYRERFPEAAADLELLSPQAAPEFKVTLTVIAGPHEGKSFAFDRHDTFVVGRASDAHFVLPTKDMYISRHHFMVEVNPPLCRLVDLKSHNKTKVNGVKADEVDLKDADEIEVGETRLKVRLESAQAGGCAAAAEATAGQPATQAMAHDWPPVPGFQLLGKLGEGGMGVVFKAVKEDTGALVALKMIKPAVKASEEVVGRFLREAKILQRLRHPHIVSFGEMNQAGDVLYFTMDYVAGRDAGRILKESGPLTIGHAVGIMCQVLEALAHAHEQGIVHRDLKPGNILVEERSEERGVRSNQDADGRGACHPSLRALHSCYVTDFGLGRAWQESSLCGLTMTGQVAGTPMFMPPEQVLQFRKVQPAGDQYSAAATLFNLLTGRHLYPARPTMQEFFKLILEQEPTPIRQYRPEVPEDLAATIHKALSRKPEARFTSVSGLLAAIRPFQDM